MQRVIAPAWSFSSPLFFGLFPPPPPPFMVQCERSVPCQHVHTYSPPARVCTAVEIDAAFKHKKPLVFKCVKYEMGADGGVTVSSGDAAFQMLQNFS